MKSDKKPLQTALNNTALPDHWALLRCRLLWAYDRVLNTEARRWSYVAYPTAAWFIRKGKVTLYFPEGRESYEAGDWVFPKQAEGDQEFSADTHILSLRFLAEWPNGKSLFDRSRSLRFPKNEASTLYQSAQKIVHFVSSYIDPQGRTNDLNLPIQAHFQLQSLFFEWLAVYHQTLQDKGIAENTLDHLHKKLQHALYCLENQSFSEPIQEKQLARSVGWSVSQFNKVFVKNFGKTPAVFWNDRRLRIAQARLESETGSIKSLAYEMGFSSPENFSHWFRTHTGYAPRDYRNMQTAHLQV